MHLRVHTEERAEDIRKSFARIHAGHFHSVDRGEWSMVIDCECGEVMTIEILNSAYKLAGRMLREREVLTF